MGLALIALGEVHGRYPARMARRVYLHIGTMKSATSYLQHLCAFNADHLASAGLLWPPGDLRTQAVMDLLGWRGAGPEVSGAWQKLARATRRHDGDVLLSFELLAGVKMGHIRRLVRSLDGEVHVVLTARDAGRLIPSHWQTTIKNGYTHTWSQFARAICAEDDDPESRRLHDWFWKRQDLAAIIGRWQQHVPVERMSVVTVPPPGSDRDEMAHRFGAAVGVDLSGLPQPETWTNVSLGAHSVELMRRLNAQLVDPEDRDESRGCRRAMGRAFLLHSDKEPGFALSAAQQDWVRRRALATNAELASLPIRVVGHLDDLVPAELPSPAAVDPSDTTEAELLEAAESSLIDAAKEAAELAASSETVTAELQAVLRQKAKAELASKRLRHRVQTLESTLGRRKVSRVARVLGGGRRGVSRAARAARARVSHRGG